MSFVLEKMCRNLACGLRPQSVSATNPCAGRHLRCWVRAIIASWRTTMTILKTTRSLTRITIAVILAAGIFTAANAQQSPYVTGSTVTGHVFCADSNAPARFAKVLLKSTEGDHSGEDFIKRLTENIEKIAAKNGETAPVKPPAEDKKQAVAAATKGMTQALDMMNASTVGLDGEFKFAGVKPGTYYVHVLYPGYIDSYGQFSDADFTSTDPAIRARIAQVPTVTVTGTDSARAIVRIERGAAISGRILYDDGSPASGWVLSTIKPGSLDSGADAASVTMNQALAMSGATQLAKTDDLGHFRITGLAAGDYALRANLIATSIGITAANIGDGGSGINLAVYAGNTFDRATAKAISVSAGEEYTGADITIPDRSLHNITGHVYAKSDSHTLNVGQVTLTSKSNPALHLMAAIRDDGSFNFEYLPGGITYTVKVEDAADGKNSPDATPGFMGIRLPNPEILRKYGTDSTDVPLGDSNIDSVRLTVAQTDWKPSATKPGATVNPGDLLKGIIEAGSNGKP
jgi:hypothetical protein